MGYKMGYRWHCRHSEPTIPWTESSVLSGFAFHHAYRYRPGFPSYCQLYGKRHPRPYWQGRYCYRIILRRRLPVCHHLIFKECHRLTRGTLLGQSCQGYYCDQELCRMRRESRHPEIPVASIKTSAQEVLRQETRLDILIHNAGVMRPPAGSTTNLVSRHAVSRSTR